MSTPPLSVLLSKVWIALVIETDNLAEAASPRAVKGLFRISYGMWANGLRVVGPGSTIEEVEGLAQARVNLPGLERWGWIHLNDRTRDDEGFGSGRGLTRSTVVRLTRAGVAAVEIWPRAVSEVEDRWRTRFGAETVDALRTVSTTEPMPWSLPQINPSDGFRSHLVGRVSWREGGRPLIAALAGRLTELTLRQERQAAASLPLAANLLHALADAPLSARQLAERTGLSKEGIAMSAGFARRNGFAVRDAARSLQLTSRGRDAATDADARAVDDHESRLMLLPLLEQADALREGLRVPAGGWRGQRPHATRTARLLADPARALPRHPMPLHRGGWPDAS